MKLTEKWMSVVSLPSAGLVLALMTPAQAAGTLDEGLMSHIRGAGNTGAYCLEPYEGPLCPMDPSCHDMTPGGGITMYRDFTPAAPIATVCTGIGTTCTYPNTTVRDPRSKNVPGLRPCVLHRRYGDYDCTQRGEEEVKLDFYTSHNSCG